MGGKAWGEELPKHLVNNKKTIKWEPKGKRGAMEGLLCSSFNSIHTFSSHSSLRPPLGDGMHKVDKENILLTL